MIIFFNDPFLIKMNEGFKIYLDIKFCFTKLTSDNKLKEENYYHFVPFNGIIKYILYVTVF